MEFPDLGKNCSTCQTLDFLPYECFWCHKIYCGSHRERSAHTCPISDPKTAQDILAKGPSTESHLVKCFHCKLPVPDIEISCCYLCHAQVCLTHRFPEQHKCQTKLKISEHNNKSTTLQTIKPKEIIIKTPAGPKGTKNLALARRVGVMKLKQKAKGLSSIPTDSRIFLSVHTHESIRTSSEKDGKPFFIDATWSIGRAVDYLADELNIINTNNRHDTQRLVVLFWGQPKEISLTENSPFESGAGIKDLVAAETLDSSDNVTLAYIPVATDNQNATT